MAPKVVIQRVTQEEEEEAAGARLARQHSQMDVPSGASKDLVRLPRALVVEEEEQEEEELRVRAWPRLRMFWRSWVLVLAPLCCAPLLVLPDDANLKEARCGFAVLIMAIFWVTEALPLAVTALMPLALFPLLGVLDGAKVSAAYMKPVIVLFLGGLVVAIAVEHCDLHRRMALMVLRACGSSPTRVLLGLMGTSMGLSMWISNTAAVAMMLPIISAVVQQLASAEEAQEEDRLRHSLDKGQEEERQLVHFGVLDHETASKKPSELWTLLWGRVAALKRGRALSHVASLGLLPVTITTASDTSLRRRSLHRTRALLYIGTCFAGNIGGTAVLTGTVPNLIFQGLVDHNFGSDTNVSFASWMIFCTPLAVLQTFCAWLWISYLLVRARRGVKEDPEKSLRMQQYVQHELHEMGSMAFRECATLVVFVLLVLAWFFRDPHFIKGWAELLGLCNMNDAVPAVAAALLLFAMPTDLAFMGAIRRREWALLWPRPPLLSWKVVQEKMPWGVLLLMGGGLAMSAGFISSGLARSVSRHMTTIARPLPHWLLVAFSSVGAAFFTELASNTATANVLLPMVSDLAVSLRMHPVYLCLPLTVACSYAFLLPVATPTNAMIYDLAQLKSTDMLGVGIITKLICLTTLMVYVHTVGFLVHDFNQFPSWADRNASVVGIAGHKKC